MLRVGHWPEEETGPARSLRAGDQGEGGRRHTIGAELETVFCAFFNSLKGWFFSLGGEKEKRKRKSKQADFG